MAFRAPEGYECVAATSTCVEIGSATDAGTDAAIDGGAEPGLACGDPQLIAESFNGGFPWWSAQNLGVDGDFAINGGRLRIDAPSELGVPATLFDEFHTTLRGNRLTVELNTVDNADFELVFFETGHVRVVVEDTMQIGEVALGGSTSRDVIAFDPSVHKFFSVAESDGVMSADVSSDGLSWTTIHSRAADFDREFGHYGVSAFSHGVSGFIEVDNINGGGPPATEACLLDRLETFDASIVDPFFTGFEVDCARAVTGGTQRWTLSNEVGAKPGCRIDTSFRVDLRGQALAVENVMFPPDNGTYYHLRIRAEGGSASFYTSGGTLHAEVCTPNCVELATSPLDLTVNRFWRIRSEVSAQALVFEVSVDGSTWTELTRKTEAFDVSAVASELRFGSDRPSNAVVEVGSFGFMP